MKHIFKSFILWYLRIAAKLQIWKMKPRIIGIGGSSGKSSLVKLIAEVLGEKYKVKHSEGKNSEIGLPLNILGLRITDNSFFDWLRILILAKWKLLTDWNHIDIYIAEMGIDGPKEPYNMSYLLKIVKPTIGVVTNVSVEHSVYFDPLVKETEEEKRKEKILDLIAKEETSLLTSLSPQETAIVNLDDTYIDSAKEHICAKKLTISLANTKAELYVAKIKTTLERFQMEFIWKEKTYTLTIDQLLPDFYAYEFLFVFAVALLLDIPLSQAILSLEKHFSLPAGRFSIFQGIKQTTIIDSSYNNATLEPIIGILDVLKKTGGTKRKIAIIGDMREQGSQSRRNHEILTEKISQTINISILIGPLLANYTAPILKRKKKKFYSYLTFSDAKKTILETIKPKDIVLVKGSQNTLFLERVVEMLLDDKRNVKKLCRRGIFWDKLRERTA